jgi:hypothetical protein
MVKLYLNKILNEVTNPQTQEAWCVADVSLLWRTEVQEALDAKLTESV